MTCAPVAASRLPVGSSANSILGWVTKARASATRCCSPPERCLGRWCARALRPTWRSDSAARSRASASAAQFQRQHHVFQRVQRGQQLERLEHETASCAAQPRAPVLVQREQVAAIEQHAAAARHVQPGEQAEQGGFAGAGRAEDRQALAGLDRET